MNKILRFTAAIIMMTSALLAHADKPRLEWIQSTPTFDNPYMKFAFYWAEDNSSDSFYQSNVVLYYTTNGSYWEKLCDLNQFCRDGEDAMMELINEYPVSKNGTMLINSDNKFTVFMNNFTKGAVSGCAYKEKSEYWADVTVYNMQAWNRALGFKIVGNWVDNRGSAKSYEIQLSKCSDAQLNNYQISSGNVSVTHSADRKGEFKCTSVPSLFGGFNWRLYFQKSANGTLDSNINNGGTYNIPASATSANVEWTLPNNTSTYTINKVTARIVKHLSVIIKDHYTSSGSSTLWSNSDLLSSEISVCGTTTLQGLRYPTTLQVTQDMWNKKNELSWKDNANSCNQAGTWCIYRSKKGDTSPAFLASQNVSNTEYTDTQVPDYNTDYTYTVAFVPDAWYTDKSASVPTSDLSTSTVSNIVPKYNINLKLEAHENDITLNWSYGATPTSDIFNATPTFYLEKKNGQVWEVINTEQVTSNSKTVSTYIDNNVSNACQAYTYRVRFTAMGATFYSNEVQGKITGVTQITAFSASKGSYPGLVKLSWDVKQMGTDATKFILRRCIAGTDEWTSSSIYTVSGENSTYYYEDNTASPGTFYDYKIECYTPCDDQYSINNSMTECGFCQTTGLIGGRISYGTGVAVKDVKVNLIKATDDLGESKQQFYSTEFTGLGSGIELPIASSDGNIAGTLSTAAFTNGFSLGMWINPTVQDNETSPVVAQIAGSSYYLSLNKDNNIYHPAIHTKNGSTEANDLSISPTNWTYIVWTMASDGTWTVGKVENDKVVRSSNTIKDAIGESIIRNTKFAIGKGFDNNISSGFTGFIDEVRVWNKALTDKEILTTYNRIITGSEAGLKLYWPLDEGINRVFDISKSGGVPNECHGTMLAGSASSVNVPTSEQLSLYALTDSIGNYVVRGIPFSGEGTNYNIVPQLGVHEFSPSSTTRMITYNSLTNNGVDFTDVSSFKVTGTIYYSGTDYPVEGCNFYVDGTICAKDGEIIESKADGTYEISVPIGDHFIQVKKNGHVFEGNGRYPLDPNGAGVYKTFTSEVSNLDFSDSTLVVFAGKVVGGSIEGNKQLGFGLSQNNIGKARLTLKPVSDHRMNVVKNSNGTTYSLDDNTATVACPSNSKNINSSSYRGSGDLCHYIYIDTDPATGEFAAMVPPVEYSVENVKVVATDMAVSNNAEIVDLSNPLVETTDTLFETGETYTYNIAFSKVYHSQPTFIVDDKTNPDDGAFGINEYKFSDVEGELNINDIYAKNTESGQYAYKYGAPIFVMGDKYNFRLEGYESYTNYDDRSNPVDSKVPLAGVVVTISNALSASQAVYMDDNSEGAAGEVIELEDNQLSLDSLGQATYTWKAGLPNISAPYSRSISMTYDINGRLYNWIEGGLPGIILGDLPTGTNFITSGPDAVQMILRDPPGTNSSAEWTSGTVTNHVSKIGSKWSTEDEINTKTNFGSKITTIVGGVGLSLENEAHVYDILEVGAKVTAEGENSNEQTVSVTTTRTISTSGEPEYVGSNGDIFFGNSTNITFGKSREVGFKRTSAGANTVEISMHDVLVSNMSFGTTFAYSQDHIVNTLIPNFDALKHSYLQTVTPDVLSNYKNTTDHMVYLTTLTDDDPLWGTNNDDATAWPTNHTNGPSSDGPSYKAFRPVDSALADSCYQDSIYWLNAQIERWKDWLAFNEEEKVRAYDNREAYLEHNISFDSGSSVNFTSENDTTNTSSKEWTAGAVAIVGDSFGATINGTGVIFELKTETGGAEEHESSDETTHSASFAYTLAEEGSGDAITVDVLRYGNYSPIFHTRGGQTCNPYEGEEWTAYYEPGRHKLNEGTMQIEVPHISVDQATIVDVPSGQAATFTLRLSNDSEIDSDIYYRLLVIDESNANGAQISVDGVPLSEGRSIKVPAGETLTKTLLLAQSNLSILDYTNIGIVLASPTQYDPTSTWALIADTVWISAQFVPSSSDVHLTASNSVMNMFTGNRLDLSFSGFDRNYYNLKAFRLQYQMDGDSGWTQLREYVISENNLTASNELLPTGASVKYSLDMDSYPDGNYCFRVVSVSSYGSDEVYKYSEEIPLAKDTARPALLGTPTPANGILTAADDINVRFNEDIRNGELTKANNFIVTGALNDANVDHSVAALFNGGTDGAWTDVSIDISGGRDFTIDMWLNRTADGNLFSLGTTQNAVNADIDADGHLVIGIAGETFISEDIVPLNKWTYLTISYSGNGSGHKLSAVCAYDGQTVDLFHDQSVGTNKAKGKLSVGHGFIGAIQEIALWNIARTSVESLASMNKTKSAGTKGLIGYWKMDEGHGNVCTDIARSRNLFLSGDQWMLQNENFAAHIEGTQPLAIDLSRASATIDENYALEFWFKADETGDATIFNSGDDKIRIDIDGDNRLTLTTNSGQFKSEAKAVPSVWHHMALNVLRGASAILYLDGNNILTVAEQSVPALQGDSLYFGGRRGFDNLKHNVFSNQMKGDFDEIRLWKASLQGKYIADNRYNKVDTTNAYGLVAYYPFESTALDQANQLFTNFSLADNSGNKSGNASATVVKATTSPALKNAPTLTNLQYTYTASEREIFLNLTDAPDRLEGTTVYFTLRNVKDMHENVNEPITWSAYVRKNPLRWTQQNIDLIAEEAQGTSFDISFTNTGGDAQQWMITGLPAWLSASQTQGTLEPESVETITFRVANSTAIGHYGSDIYLVGNSGIYEPLDISLIITGDTPDWTVDTENLDKTMNLTAQLILDGAVCENSDTRVAAFIGDMCIGVAQPMYLTTRDAYYLCMTLYGNDEISRQPVDFKVWDASKGIIYSGVTASEDITFADGMIYGTFSKPVILTTLNVIEQQIALNKGWNWTSLYVQPLPADLASVMNDYAEYITIVKNRTSFAMSDGTHYEGSLASIRGAKLYMMYAAAATTFTTHGQPISAEEGKQTITKNWNWIGNPSQTTLSLDRALAGMDPETDDLIKSRTAFAIYNGYTWEGTLTSIEPGKGYLYHSVASNAKTLIYPETAAGTKERRAPLMAAEAGSSNFEVGDMSQYSGNMTVVAEVYINDVKTDTLEVATFDGNEYRSADRATNGRYFITIPGEGNEPEISFRTILDGCEVELSPTVIYSNDAMLGSLTSPIRLEYSASTGIDGINANAANGAIHSVTGIRVGDSLDNLPRGIYILNGKKVLVK